MAPTHTFHSSYLGMPRGRGHARPRFFISGCDFVWRQLNSRTAEVSFPGLGVARFFTSAAHDFVLSSSRASQLSKYHQGPPFYFHTHSTHTHSSSKRTYESNTSINLFRTTISILDHYLKKRGIPLFFALRFEMLGSLPKGIVLPILGLCR